ncbi:Sirtuin 2 [Carabus blaptoides fortunei]
MASKPKVDTAEDSGSSDETASGSMTLEGLRKYLATKLNFNETEEQPKPKILEDVSVGEIASLIRNKKCTNIITMAGAGISTSAGIPDFRSPGSGLYANLQKYNLPHPQAVFELDFFDENPKPFFALAKELYPGSFKPTICHYFLKILEQKGLLLRHYTQNIDTLERVAGISDEKLVEAHGTFYTGHCLCCRKEYSLSWMKERIFDDKIPICNACPGVVKPDIVFFGENLPDKFYKCMNTDFQECDLLIVMGSSLVVQPFASLVDRVPDNCPRLLINREKVGLCSGIMAMLGMGGGFDFDSPNNTRDVAWLGDCDEGCQLLADKLGWGEELKEMVATEHKRIDDEHKAKSKSTLSVKKQAVDENKTLKNDVKDEKKTSKKDAKDENKTSKKDAKGEKKTPKKDADEPKPTTSK